MTDATDPTTPTVYSQLRFVVKPGGGMAYDGTTPQELLDQVRDAIRLKHYSIRTEEAYVNWVKRYIYSGVVRRHHLHESSLQKAIKEAGCENDNDLHRMYSSATSSTGAAWPFAVPWID